MENLNKEKITEYAKSIGAQLVGFAPVSRWEDHGVIPKAFRPNHVWPQTKTVISMVIPSLLPTVETKLSHIYRNQYHNTNSLLDRMAYKLAAYLNRHGYASINISRDGYGYGANSAPVAAFSHVWAGYYAGLGTFGWNHTLVTPEFGPRHRLVSVLTALELEGTPLIKEELCNKCRICEKVCLGKCFSGNKEDTYSAMVRISCRKRRQDTSVSHCGFCIKFCPIGKDRDLYKSKNIKRYFDELENTDNWSLGVGAKVKDWKIAFS